MIRAKYPEKEIIDHLVQHTDFLLRKDFDGNGQLDFSDLFSWNPVEDKDCLSRQWHLFASYSDSILNNASYYDELEKITTSVIGYAPVLCSSPGSIEDPCLPSVEAVAANGNYAYSIGLYSGFNVIDISAPESPVFIARLDSESCPLDLALVDSYALVAAASGLYVYDIENPNNPKLETLLPQMELTGITVSGSFAYASSSQDGIYVFDISDLKNPMETSHLELPGPGNGIAMMGTCVLIAGGASGLHIVDVSNPTVPTLTKTIDTNNDICIRLRPIRLRGSR